MGKHSRSRSLSEDDSDEIHPFHDNMNKYTIIKNLDDDFAHAKLGPLKVIIMKKNGFANATRMCKEVDKRYSNWAKLEYSKELIEDIHELYGGSPKIKSEIHVVDGPKLTRGVYVHPSLIINVAYWCNTGYNASCCESLLDCYAREAAQQ